MVSGIVYMRLTPLVAVFDFVIAVVYCGVLCFSSVEILLMLKLLLICVDVGVFYIDYRAMVLCSRTQ